jgi:hypothetical protein
MRGWWLQAAGLLAKAICKIGPRKKTAKDKEGANRGDRDQGEKEEERADIRSQKRGESERGESPAKSRGGGGGEGDGSDPRKGKEEAFGQPAKGRGKRQNWWKVVVANAQTRKASVEGASQALLTCMSTCSLGCLKREMGI